MASNGKDIASLNVRANNQPFDYLLVLDFEATCWPSTSPFHKPHTSEIIEFPCVLYDVRQNKILEVFQQYVRPTEYPILSSYCTQLTGIYQKQVSNGVLLGACLKNFMNWVNILVTKYQFTIGCIVQGYKNCTFATWSNWDLGVYLVNECKRKGVIFPMAMSNWIDLRNLFHIHYRSKAGLHQAMKNVGLIFEGRQHCGLDDAMNTARLVGKMISDGVYLRLTSSANLF